MDVTADSPLKVPLPTLSDASRLGLTNDEAERWVSLFAASHRLHSAGLELVKVGLHLPMATHLKLLALRLEVLAAAAEMLPCSPNPDAYEDGMVNLCLQRNQLRSVLERFPESLIPKLFELNKNVESTQRRLYVAMGLVPHDFEAELADPRAALPLKVRDSFGGGPLAALVLRRAQDLPSA